jgi:hypothetical protein
VTVRPDGARFRSWRNMTAEDSLTPLEAPGECDTTAGWLPDDLSQGISPPYRAVTGSVCPGIRSTRCATGAVLRVVARS